MIIRPHYALILPTTNQWGDRHGESDRPGDRHIEKVRLGARLLGIEGSQGKHEFE
ncbi:MAG: hypothetical protein HC792_04565 [Acaryochloridaceae cyanobacterium CSU_5_19]|nr:hypothetical protein [Acaryochloridaceae cyanobacterium CSU_5_19]